MKWILQYPAPLLLCIVDKKAARFSVYHLTARFQAAVMTEPPASLMLVPGDPGKTDPTHRPAIGWDAEGRMQLGPPILHFTLDQFLDDETYQLIGRVLDYWIVNDLRNILRQQMGMRAASGPPDYVTNEVPPSSGFGMFSMTVVPPEIRERAGKTAAEHLDWLGHVMLARGDPTGALLAALIVRHLIPDADPGLLGFSPTSLYAQVGGIARQAFPEVADVGSLVGPFDAVLAELNQRTQGGG